MADLTARRAILGALALGAASSRAQSTPLTLSVTQSTPHNFTTLLARTEAAITAHNMLILARASASEGAAKRGITIPGNAVFLIFHNDFAVRMLAASIAAGIEAPIPIYLTENPDGTTAIAYRRPSVAFAPYAAAARDAPALAAMARELDTIFAAIAPEAAGHS